MADRRPQTVGRQELLTDGTDTEFRTFLHSFMVFSRRLDAIRGFFAQEIGVTGAQYEILSHLREHGDNGGLTVGEAAARLHCSGAFVTAEVGKLTRAGLVKRKRDPDDARRVRLTLSAACERRFRDMAPVQQELNDTLFASLSTRQFEALRRTFARLVEDGDRAVALAEFFAKDAAASGGP